MSSYLIDDSKPYALTESAFRKLLALQEKPNESAIKKIQSMDSDDYTEYYRERYSYSLLPGGIAVLPIEGELFRYDNWMTYSGYGSSYTGLTFAFQSIMNNNEVSSIILYINSPGGSVDGTGEFVDLIKSCSKPISAFTSGMCASAAYWIASACNNITAYDTTLVGSIGVIATMYQFKRLQQEMGVDEYVFKSKVSPYKNLDPSIQEEADRIQILIDDLGDIFVAQVATNRGVSTDYVIQNYGQGDVMTAIKAKASGIIDAISNFPNYLNSIVGNNSNMISASATRISGECTPGKEPQSEDTTDTTEEPTKEGESAGEDEMPTEEPEAVDGEDTTDTTEDPKKEEEMKKAISSNPKIASIAIQLERNRQQKIDGLLKEYPGQASLINSLRYNSNLSPGDIAMKAIDQNTKNKKDYSNKLNTDGKNLLNKKIGAVSPKETSPADFGKLVSSKLQNLRGAKS